jgi:hypothetical protein
MAYNESFAGAVQASLVALIAKEGDGTLQLNSDGINQINESLMDKIDQIDLSGTKNWSGYLQIQCKDLFTLNWL